MHSIFDSNDRAAILARIAALQPSSTRQWGKMNPAQMLGHLAATLEMVLSESSTKQKLLGKILTPFIRSLAIGEKPFGRNSPTDPSFVISDERDFEKERERLRALLGKVIEQGPETAGKRVHIFFGKLSGAEWGVLIHKHFDHHLRQFSV